MTDAIDLFLSDKIGKVTRCGATSVAPEFPNQATWLSTFVLKVVFQDQPPEARRHIALQFVRRVENAILEYSEATRQLSQLVTESTKRASRYFRALYHFEAAIAQLYLSYDGARTALGQNYFNAGDGSVLDRLNKLFNASKHGVAVGEQPVWITDVGIGSATVSLCFSELEGELRRAGCLVEKILAGQQAGA